MQHTRTWSAHAVAEMHKNNIQRKKKENSESSDAKKKMRNKKKFILILTCGMFVGLGMLSTATGDQIRDIESTII